MDEKRSAEFLEIPELVMTHIKVRGLFGREKFRRAVRTSGELRFYSEYLGKEVIVPKDFLSDGASIPQPFWWLWNPFGAYLESAVLHDYFCRLGKAWDSPINFKEAAYLFGEAMIIQGVSLRQAKIMVTMVLIFGPKFAAQSK